MFLLSSSSLLLRPNPLHRSLIHRFSTFSYDKFSKSNRSNSDFRSNDDEYRTPPSDAPFPPPSSSQSQGGFHLNLKTSYLPPADRGGFGGSYSKQSTGSEKLPPPPQWNNLQPLPNTSYIPHPDVENFDPADIREWRKKNLISIDSSEVPNPILEFSQAWNERIVEAFARRGINAPLPIQAQTWPILLQGRNLIGVAQTGSGKTLGFLLPFLKHIMNLPNKQLNGLILAPTRELATQIHDELGKVLHLFNPRFNSALLYGGAPKSNQQRELFRMPEIIVATPGRLIDFVSMGIVNLNTVSKVILDEADRLLEMGMEEDIRAILSHTRPDRQTIMYTATWPKKVHQLARDHIRNPLTVRVGAQAGELVAAETITQVIQVCQVHEKLNLVIQVLEQLKDYSQQNDLPFKIIIFCNSKAMVDQLEHFLYTSKFSIPARAFHGDKPQSDREKTLSQFRSGRAGILLASDAASRGLDVRDVLCVVNYDFPRTIEDYVHRIGRTGRAGKFGTAISFFTRMDSRLKRDLEQVLKRSNQPIPQELNHL